MEEQEIRRRRGDYQLLDEEKEEYDDQEQEKIIQDLKNDFEKTSKLQNTIFNLLISVGIGVAIILMTVTYGLITYIPGIIIEFVLYLIHKHQTAMNISYVLFGISVIFSCVNPENLKIGWRVLYNIVILISIIFKKYAYDFSKSMPEQIKHLESLKYPNPKA